MYRLLRNSIFHIPITNMHNLLKNSYSDSNHDYKLMNLISYN